MALDSRLKRNSALAFQQPWMVGVSPDTAGLSQAERQAVLWCYSGILAAAPSAVVGIVSAVYAILQPMATYAVLQPSATYVILQPSITATGES